MRPFASRGSSWVSATMVSSLCVPLRPRARLLPEDALEDPDRELSSDHRSDAQAALGVVGQLVDPGQEEAVERVRDLDRRDLLGCHPALITELDDPALDQH